MIVEVEREGAVWDPIEYACPHDSIVPRDDIIAGMGTATIDKYTASLDYGGGLFKAARHVCNFECVTV
jgi:hypothetical protein